MRQSPGTLRAALLAAVLASAADIGPHRHYHLPNASGRCADCIHAFPDQDVAVPTTPARGGIEPQKHLGRGGDDRPVAEPPEGAVGRRPVAQTQEDVQRISADPQVCSTAMMPIRAPRCLGSAAIVASVSAAALSRRP